MLQFLALTAIALSPHAHGPHTQPVAAPIIEAPNIVTPLLPHGYKRAQEKSKVSLPGYNATELYSGFFTIDESTNSNTYFLFSTAQSKRKDAPVILWLNGGPGASSLLGFFDELGPFGIDENMKMVPREVSWNRDAHLLALDNPLGVGYSFTDSRSRMATNQTTVGADLYGALDQFFRSSPTFGAMPFTRRASRTPASTSLPSPTPSTSAIATRRPSAKSTCAAWASAMEPSIHRLSSLALGPCSST